MYQYYLASCPKGARGGGGNSTYRHEPSLFPFSIFRFSFLLAIALVALTTLTAVAASCMLLHEMADALAAPVPLADVRYLIDPVDGAKLVTVPDAAAIMGCGVRTVHGWVAKGLVEVRRTPTGQARIVVSSLWKRPTSQEVA